MSGQPNRQVEVEVVRSLVCVAASQISQRAAEPVGCENPAFGEHQASQDSRAEKVTPGSREGNCHDTAGEDKPNRRVQKLYRCQDRDPLPLKFHEKSSLALASSTWPYNKARLPSRAKLAKSFLVEGGIHDPRFRHLARQPLSKLLAGQRLRRDVPGGRRPRPHYQALHDLLLELPLAEMRRRKQAADVSFLHQGITFTVYGREEGTERIFPHDLLPRIITSAEWDAIERGLTQRITALNLFLRDIYNEGRCLTDGVVPREMVYSCKHFRRQMRGFHVPKNIYVAVVGTDLIRLPDGRIRGAGRQSARARAASPTC